MSDAYGRRGRWIDMLQDFSFKIQHRLGVKHINVDALSRNPVGVADDDDFGCEFQDLVRISCTLPPLRYALTKKPVRSGTTM